MLFKKNLWMNKMVLKNYSNNLELCKYVNLMIVKKKLNLDIFIQIQQMNIQYKYVFNVWINSLIINESMN